MDLKYWFLGYQKRPYIQPSVLVLSVPRLFLSAMKTRVVVAGINARRAKAAQDLFCYNVL